MHFLTGLGPALALAVPFLFSSTRAPLTNFWPLMCAWLCAGVLALLLVWQVRRPDAPDRRTLARQCAAGVLLAALLGSAVGLLQYFGQTDGWWGWLHPAQPGVAMGQLRQRNQQASLLSLGLWTLWWLVAQVPRNGPDGARGHSVLAVGLGLLLAWALALLVVGSAATASRTGLAQWLVLLVLLAWWRKSLGALPLALALAGLLLYAWAAWLLPDLLLRWTGVQAEGLFQRFGEAPGCTSRRVLWANVWHLILQRPWTGWGWGELDYAHYITLFPGTRFCVLLDNAHNLPLHLAVELGLPAAALACAAVAWWVWRARPWAETDPVRQWAWGILAVVGLHSMLEFPLWYGPFQVVTVLALVLLWRGRAARAAAQMVQHMPWGLWALAGMLCLALWAALGWQYHRVSQIYLPAAQRIASMRDDPLAQVQDSWVFRDAMAFAELTTTPVTPETAPRVHALALRMLHYSPEPRVIERLIESATLLGLDEEAAFHLQRYRAAYPADFARWSRTNQPLGTLAGD
ncbi:Wzy polymerase domain-containing protein [Comamonas granuli]|uniref:Wzy polymerase domain-containing protein n=1 Tax=Comamonas granuli TaxID=290309 RepID=UPI0005AA9470|nr:Wzy polymerase domain-containing protein [Comamonas granuli]